MHKYVFVGVLRPSRMSKVATLAGNLTSGDCSLMRRRLKREFLNVDACARRLGVSGRTITRLVAAGSVRGFQAGIQWRVTEADLEDYVRSRTPRRQEAA
jgi:excisionase family DNA binding protein